MQADPQGEKQPLRKIFLATALWIGSCESIPPAEEAEEQFCSLSPLHLPCFAWACL